MQPTSHSQQSTVTRGGGLWMILVAIPLILLSAFCGLGAIVSPFIPVEDGVDAMSTLDTVIMVVGSLVMLTGGVFLLVLGIKRRSARVSHVEPLSGSTRAPQESTTLATQRHETPSSATIASSADDPHSKEEQPNRKSFWQEVSSKISSGDPIRSKLKPYRKFDVSYAGGHPDAPDTLTMCELWITPDALVMTKFKIFKGTTQEVFTIPWDDIVSMGHNTERSGSDAAKTALLTGGMVGRDNLMTPAGFFMGGEKSDEFCTVNLKERKGFQPSVVFKSKKARDIISHIGAARIKYGSEVE